MTFSCCFLSGSNAITSHTPLIVFLYAFLLFCLWKGSQKRVSEWKKKVWRPRDASINGRKIKTFFLAAHKNLPSLKSFLHSIFIHLKNFLLCSPVSRWVICFGIYCFPSRHKLIVKTFSCNSTLITTQSLVISKEKVLHQAL